MGLAQESIEGIDREEYEKEVHLCRTCHCFASNVTVKKDKIICNDCYEEFEKNYAEIRIELDWIKQIVNIDDLKWIVSRIKNIKEELSL